MHLLNTYCVQSPEAETHSLVGELSMGQGPAPPEPWPALTCCPPPFPLRLLGSEWPPPMGRGLHSPGNKAPVRPVLAELLGWRKPWGGV